MYHSRFSMDLTTYSDIVETMATSDNVIRAGLTPKLRDVPNLIATLTYTAADASKHAVKPQPFGPAGTQDPFADAPSESALYDPPAPEFSVVRVRAPAGGSSRHEALRGPSLFIVTRGDGKVHWAGEGGEAGEMLREGRVFFVGARTAVTFEAGSVGELEVYRAFVETKT